ncbi:MAG: hypothetical protein H7Z14_14255 [Anaerolineae bacterium]|nr:hypothetical protein [Phycisphaerae bacterium]
MVIVGSFTSGTAMTNWLHFFERTIDAIKKPLSIVLESSGCRQGWLQGEFFRAGRKYGVSTDEHPLGGEADASTLLDLT